MKEAKVKLALGILSGRIKRLDDTQHQTLGCGASIRPPSFGWAVNGVIKQDAENIILEALCCEGFDP